MGAEQRGTLTMAATHRLSFDEAIGAAAAETEPETPAPADVDTGTRAEATRPRATKRAAAKKATEKPVGRQARAASRPKPAEAPKQQEPKPEPVVVTPPPAAAGSVVRYPKRVTLPLTEEDYRALARARAEDDIDIAARLRAMLSLWKDNARHRSQVDRLARKLS
jgi:hypothetical protein